MSVERLGGKGRAARAQKMMWNDPGALCGSSMLSMMPQVKETCPQRSAIRHRRSHRQERPTPPETAAAPSIERQPQEHERGSLRHCSRAARSNEVARTSGGANRQVLLASNREIASGTRRLRSTGAAPHEPARECVRERLYIIFDGDSGKTILTGWRARHHTPPATGAMHALYVCAHGGVIYI